jgi:putative MFS transporter
MTRSTVQWVDPLVDSCGFGRYQFLLLIQTGATSFASAAIFVILGSMISHLPLRSWGVSSVEAGLLQSAIFVGVTMGTLIGGIFADRYGRRTAILLAYTVLIAACVLLVTATSFVLMVSACLLFGAVGGFTIPPMNALLLESSPLGRRGDLVCLSSGVWFAGELYGAACVWFVVGAHGVPNAMIDFTWRICFLLGFLPAAPVVLYAWISLQESPRFLASCGRIAEAESSIAVMASTNGVSVPHRSLQDAETQAEELEEKPHGMSLEQSLQLLTRWPVSITTLCLMVLCIVINFAYYGLIFALPQILHDQKGAMKMMGGASVQVFVVTLFKIPGICLAYVLLRTPQVGHKTSLAALLAITCCTSWAYPALIDLGHVAGAFAAACGLKLATSAVFIILYIFVLEIYPTQVRSTGMALCTMVGRIGSIMSPLVHSYATAYGGHDAYFLIIAMIALTAGGTAMFIPMDTKGRPLGEGEDSEMTQLLAHKK